MKLRLVVFDGLVCSRQPVSADWLQTPFQNERQN